MNAKKFAVVSSLIVALIVAFGAPWQMQGQENKTPYPNMAPRTRTHRRICRFAGK